MDWRYLAAGAAVQMLVGIEVWVLESFIASRPYQATAAVLVWMALATKSGGR